MRAGRTPCSARAWYIICTSPIHDPHSRVSSVDDAKSALFEAIFLIAEPLAPWARAIVAGDNNATTIAETTRTQSSNLRACTTGEGRVAAPPTERARATRLPTRSTPTTQT